MVGWSRGGGGEIVAFRSSGIHSKRLCFNLKRSSISHGLQLGVFRVIRGVCLKDKDFVFA